MQSNLCIHIRLVTDDLDCSLVRTYRTVRTQSPELTFDRTFRLSRNTFCVRQECPVTSSSIPMVKWFFGFVI